MTSTILLAHLQAPNTTIPSIPLPTLQSVLSHHLSNAPSTSASSTTLTVTQLAATAISSPFFLSRSQPYEYAKLQAFEAAFRHAVHLLRQQQSKKDDVNLSRWTEEVIKGIQGGHPLLRLAACGGILLGVEDLKNNADMVAKVPIKLSRKSVEFETVVALAEVLDSTTVHTEWEHEFQHQGQPQQHSSQRPPQNTLLLAFILASHSLPLIDSQRLTALPLHTLARLLTSTLVPFFDPPDPDPNLKPNTTTNTTRDISHVSSLAKLTSVVLNALLDSTHSRTYTRNLTIVSDIFNTLLDLSKTIEQAHSITDPSNQIPKQFLFTAIIIIQSVLSSIAYLRPHIISYPNTSTTPPALALVALQTLTHLSLVISQYGGITKAFEQLQKAFYLSIDIILAPSQNQNEVHNANVEAHVQRLSHFLQSQSPETATTLPFRAKLSFALSTFEQLVPVLSPHCIINHVWSVCYPYITNVSESNREIYESAHSVVLSILIHDPKSRQESIPTSGLDPKKDHEERILWTEFTLRLVPFYAKRLVDDTTLTIPQVTHAYSSLVQCATALSILAQANTTNSTSASALPWYCVQLILDTIDELSSASPSSPESQRKDHLHRLHLMLASTLPSLPLDMLDRCLENVRAVLVGYHSKDKDTAVGVNEEERQKDKERKKELVKTLFELLLSERMGDGEKEVGVKWWYDNLGLIRGVDGGEKDEDEDEERGVMLQSRL